MAISYTDIRKLVSSQAFQDRLQVAIWREASKLLRQTNPVPPAAVLTWARAELKGVTQNMTEATIRVATQGKTFEFGEAVTDQDLQQDVKNIASDLAGVP